MNVRWRIGIAQTLTLIVCYAIATILYSMNISQLQIEYSNSPNNISNQHNNTKRQPVRIEQSKENKTQSNNPTLLFHNMSKVPFILDGKTLDIPNDIDWIRSFGGLSGRAVYMRDENKIKERGRRGNCTGVLDVFAWLMEEVHRKNGILLIAYGGLIHVNREKDFVDKNGNYLDDDIDTWASLETLSLVGTLEPQLYNKFGWSIRIHVNGDDRVVLAQIVPSCGHAFTAMQKSKSSQPAIEIYPFVTLPREGEEQSNIIKDLWQNGRFPEEWFFPVQNLTLISSGSATTAPMHLQVPHQMIKVIDCLYGNWKVRSSRRAGGHRNCLPPQSSVNAAHANKQQRHIVKKIAKNDPIVENKWKIKKFAEMKVMLYITTHMSEQHDWYLRSCWPDALKHSLLLNSSDVTIYLNPSKDRIEMQSLQNTTSLLQETFQHQNLTIHVRDNPGYNSGAKAALSDARKEGWFEGYDWVFRMNPDVIVRNDSFILDVMQTDSNAAGILIKCSGYAHTDFFAIKPNALSKDAFLGSNTLGAERSFTDDIRNTILLPGRHRWIENSNPKNAICRAGYGRQQDKADVVHSHQPKELMTDFTSCPLSF